ncbi:MAG: AAA family ATPase [Deltaproteobacteria bacterium]|nr:AAA family ATPase [Deltaproteobacteria bacterium]
MSALSLNIQSFREIREEGRHYVDKTEYIHRLLADGRSFFLARPARFGKTLLLSAIEEFFTGNRAWFGGLYLGESDRERKKHPVVYLDMALLGAESPASVKDELCFLLRKIALREGVAIQGGSPATLARFLLEAVGIKYRQKVVLLIDNCDFPATAALGDPEKARLIARALGDFYGGLRSLHPRLRFVMATGTFKYEEMAQNSGLSFLRDISLSPRYAGICGFTAQEAATGYAGRLASALDAFRAEGAFPGEYGLEELLAEVARWYGGYSFDGELQLINPHSFLSFLENGAFGRHWPSRLDLGYAFRLLREDLGALRPNPELLYGKDELETVSLSATWASSFLRGLGFLTLQNRVLSEGARESALAFPNHETVSGLYGAFLAHLAGRAPVEARAFARSFRREAEKGDGAELARLFSAFLAKLKEAPHQESPAFYRAVFGLALSLSGFRFKGASFGEGPVEGILKIEGGLGAVVKCQYLPKDAAGEGERKRLLAEELRAALEKASPEDESALSKGTGREYKEIFLLATGRADFLGGAVSQRSGLIFRPLAKAPEE